MDYNKPYILREAGNLPYNGYALFKDEERQTDPIIFMQGHSLPFDTGNSNLSATLQPVEEYDLVYSYRYPEEKLKGYDCMPNTGYAPLVNTRVLEILQELCPHDIQAFPATIVSEVPKKFAFENHDYWVINITKTVDGIDKELSDFERLPEKLGSVPIGTKKLVMREYENTYHIARDTILGTHILVSPTLVKAFKKAKIKGVKFLKDTEC